MDMKSATSVLNPPASGALKRVGLSRVTMLCLIGMFSEGYDMGVLGSVLPALLHEPSWHLTSAIVGVMASAAVVGMFFGALIFGSMSDKYGRKAGYMACIAIFSTATGLTAFSPNPTVFAITRFFAGIGVGGIVPIASALTTEFAPPGKKAREFAIIFAGYSMGIFASSLAAFALIESYGWRTVVALGALPLLALPLIAVKLPESCSYLLAAGRKDSAMRIARKFNVDIGEIVRAIAPGTGCDRAARGSIMALLTQGNLRATMGFWFTTLLGMVLVYGLTTWLPQIMREAGYDLGPSILFLGVFAVASAVGAVLLGWLADRGGHRRTIAAGYTIGGMAIAVLSFKTMLPVTYMVVALAGLGTIAASATVTGYLSAYFPDGLRATAVGSAISFSRVGAIAGPFVGGMIASAGLDYHWNFYAFALICLVAAVVIQLVPDKV